MKRETSPHTPYKRKAKGKETSRGYFGNPLSPRGRVRREHAYACTYAEAGLRARQLCDILGIGPAHADYIGHLQLWSFYCRRFDWYTIREKAFECASCERQGEIRSAVAAFQHFLTTTFPKNH